jgi:hypothetical protein
MSLKINNVLLKHQPPAKYDPVNKQKPIDTDNQKNQALRHLAVRFSADDDKTVKKSKPAKPETYTRKATIIKLKEGQKELSHQDLSYRVVRETLLRNNIKPSRIEMEEIMALPQNQHLDLNDGAGKNDKRIHVPGDMPYAGLYKDINGNQAFGYKFTLTPKWQADIINDYKQVRGELAKPENVDKKAVLDMNMKERLKETLKIAWDKGYISDEVKSQVGSITALEAIVTAGVGGGLALLASTELGSAVVGPAGMVLGTAYFAKKTMEFAQVAEDAGNAKSRNGLDKSAKGMGQLIGSLARDGVLTAIGVAGGFAATKGMPPLERAISNKTGQVKEILTRQPEGVTPEGVRIKVPKTEEVKGSNVDKMTASEYKDLRKKTPSKEIRDAVNPDGPKIDPVYKYYVERLEADHIVSMKEITKMPGFETLTKAQKIEVLNLRDNFLGLGKSTNASKGAKTWADWAGHKKLGEIPTEVRAKMIEIERLAKIEVQKAINERLPK